MSAWRDEVDTSEHDYWRAWCPACDRSPCVGGRRGACVERERPEFYGRPRAGVRPAGVDYPARV